MPGNILREFITLLTFRSDDRDLTALDLKIKQANATLGKFAKVASLTLTPAITGVGVASVMAAAQFEQLDMAFGVMLQDGDKGSKLLKDLFDFAAKTPFEIEEIGPVAKQMLAMGSTSESLLDDLKMLGDTAAGLGVPIWRLALNFGQMRAQGKLTGRELRDFAVAGVPLLDELAKATGKSKSEVQAMVSAGQVSFDMVRDVFKKMTSEGGRFANMMDKQSKTLGGLWSNFLDNLFQARIRLGQVIVENLKLHEVVKGVNEVMGRLVDWFTKLNPNAQRIIIIVAGLAAALPPLIVGLQAAAVAAKMLGLGFWSTAMPLLFLIGLLTLFIDDFMVWKEGGDSILGAVLGSFEDWSAAAKDIFGGFADWLGALFTGQWDKVVEGLDHLLKTMGILIEDFMSSVQAELTAEQMQRERNVLLYPVSGTAIRLGEFIGGLGVTKPKGPTGELSPQAREIYRLQQIGQGGIAPANVDVTVNVPSGVTDPEGIGRAVGVAVDAALERSSRQVTNSNAGVD